MATATHAVCPLCSKSSSLRSFPSGDGTDIILQTFRGMGRGKGFAVEAKVSGLDNRDVCMAVKPKVLNLVTTLAEHGYVDAYDLVRVVKPLGLHVHSATEEHPVAALQKRVLALEAELKLEKSSRDFHDKEVAELQAHLDREQPLRESAEVRAAVLSQQLEQSKRAWTRLVSAYRESILSLRKLRRELEGTKYAASTVMHVARNIEEMAQLVQELRALSFVKAAAHAQADHTR